MKKIIFLSIVALLVFGGVMTNVGAQGVASGTEITIEDLGVGEPNILPTNPLYFLKTLGRGVQKFFTFGKTAKAQFELRLANTHAAEIKVLSDREEGEKNTEGLERAIEKYDTNMERLRERLGTLETASENPNIRRLLDELAERVLKHDQLFEELSLRKEALRENLANTKTRLEEAGAQGILLDTPENVRMRFEEALANIKENPLKE